MSSGNLNIANQLYHVINQESNITRYSFIIPPIYYTTLTLWLVVVLDIVR